MKKIANRFFYKIDNQGRPIPGTLARFNKKPVQGKWLEISDNICCTSIVGCNLFSLVHDATDMDGAFITNVQILKNGVEISPVLPNVTPVILNSRISYCNLMQISPNDEITFNVVNDPTNICISYSGFLEVYIYNSDGTIYDIIHGSIYDSVGSITASFTVIPNKIYRIQANVGCGQ